MACGYPNAKLVMLLRDPTLRTISEHNDEMIRGHQWGGTKKSEVKSKSEEKRRTLSSKALILSNYNSILKNFLKYYPPENILIVQSEFLQDKQHLQEILHAVQDHYGVPRRLENDCCHPRLNHGEIWAASCLSCCKLCYCKIEPFVI